MIETKGYVFEQINANNNDAHQKVTPLIKCLIKNDILEFLQSNIYSL